MADVWLVNVLCVLLVTTIQHCDCADDRRGGSGTSSLIRNLLRDYHSSDLPWADKTTTVEWGLFAERLEVLENKMLTWHIRVKQIWRDPRLSYDKADINYIHLYSAHVRQLWIPDTYYSNAMKVTAIHHGLSPAYMASLYPNGTLWFNQKLQITTGCIRWKKTNHLDCSLMVESMRYTADELEFQWLAPAIEFAQEDAGLGQQGYSLSQHKQENCSNSQLFTSCLRMVLSIECGLREGHGISCAVAVLLVITSWLSFWIDGNKISERAGVLLAATLILVVLKNGLSEGSPQTESMVGGCMLFALAAMLEYAIAYCLLQWIPAKLKKKDFADQGSCGPVSRMLDIICGLVVFPVVFVIFLIATAASYF